MTDMMENICDDDRMDTRAGISKEHTTTTTQRSGKREEEAKRGDREMLPRRGAQKGCGQAWGYGYSNDAPYGS